MKKDLIIWWMRTIVGLALLWYVIFIWFNQLDIIPNKTWNYDLTVLVIIWAISAMMIFSWLVKPCFKRPRTMQAIMWAVLILLPYYVGIQDNLTNYLFLWDILKVIGSLALALSFGKVCVYEKCEKKQEEEEVEIIEV